MSSAPTKTTHRANAFLALVAAAALTAAACGGGGDDGGSPTSPSGPPPPSAPYSQTDLAVGTGTEVTAGRTATVHYTLWLYDPAQAESKGRQLETSAGGQPFSFPVGAGRVIRGWDQGVPGMRVGGRRRLIIPPELAYGSAGQGSVPPNATLVFDIELLAVN
jgi:FKBP-type peptidyl-prolyl cis-trans isomerase FkpA